MASKQININNQSFDISYQISNIQNKKTIIFLHGWASNKELMQQAFGQSLLEYKHIYIDLPGFGKSSNTYVLNTQEYANIMKEFLRRLNINPHTSTIAGHSFGGKLATLLKPEFLVLLSSAGILENKSTKTLLTIRMAKIFNKFGLGKVTKLLRSKDVNMMSQTMYETFKNVVDEDFSKSFEDYKGKSILFWGEKDTATTLQSGKEIHKLIQNSEFHSYNDDHYFFLRHFEDISKKISSF